MTCHHHQVTAVGFNPVTPRQNPVLDKYPVKKPAVENTFVVLGFKPQSKNPAGFNILVTHFPPTFPPPQVQVYFPRDGTLYG